MAGTTLTTTNGTALTGRPLSTDDARTLTDEARADAQALWTKLLRLYDGGAHTALGYSSWGAYFKAEFGEGQSRGYQLLDAGRVLKRLQSTMVEWSTPLPLPANERQARELAKAPEVVQAAVWQEVVQTAPEGEVTAEYVAEVVDRYTEPALVLDLEPAEDDADEAEDEQSSPEDEEFWGTCRALDGLIGDLQDARRSFGSRLRSDDLAVPEIRDFRTQAGRIRDAVAALHELRERAEQRRMERGGKPMPRPPVQGPRPLGRQKRLLLDALTRLGEATTRDLTGETGLELHIISSRLSSLRRDGFVVATGERRVREDGHTDAIYKPAPGRS